MEPDETTGRRRGGVLLLALIALAGMWVAGWFSGDPGMPGPKALRADPLHQEALRDVEAANDLAARFVDRQALAEIRDLRPAGKFDGYDSACGYRIDDGDVERVIVVGKGVIYEHVLGGGEVFHHIDTWVGCPRPSDEGR